MNRFHFASLSLIVIAGMTAPAAADEPRATGAYVAVGLGPDSVADSSLQYFGQTYQSKWADGWGGFVAGGYRWANGLRAEIEGSGRQAQVKSFDANPWFGIQWDTSLMANAFYDFRTGSAFTPYLGGGVGLSHISWGNDFRGENHLIFDGSGTEFAWQGIAGIAYAVTQRLELTMDVRVKGSSGYSFRGPLAGYDITKFDYMTRSLFFGVRYAID